MCSYKDYSLSPDTTPEAESLLFELLAKKSPAEKVEMVGQMSATMRTLAVSGLRDRYPAACETELKVNLAQLLYGDDIAERIGERLKNSHAMNDAPIEITFKVIDALDKLGIRYLIGGSLASSIFGEPRATRGTDLLADIRIEHAKALCEALESEFYISIEAIEHAVRHRSRFNVIHFQSVFKVDIFVPRDRPFDQREFERAEVLAVSLAPERRACVASVEDIILAKLEWYRQGKEVSTQQWRDITGMFKTNENRLDVSYMRQTADELNVVDLLQRLIPIE